MFFSNAFAAPAAANGIVEDHDFSTADKGTVDES